MVIACMHVELLNEDTSSLWLGFLVSLYSAIDR